MTMSSSFKTPTRSSLLSILLSLDIQFHQLAAGVGVIAYQTWTQFLEHPVEVIEALKR